MSPFEYVCDNVFIENGVLFAEVFPDDLDQIGIKGKVAFACGHWVFHKIETVIYTMTK